MAPVVAALQAMRGVALVVAVTVVAEVGDFRLFANARQPMAYGFLQIELSFDDGDDAILTAYREMTSSTACKGTEACVCIIGSPLCKDPLLHSGFHHPDCRRVCRLRR